MDLLGIDTAASRRTCSGSYSNEGLSTTMNVIAIAGSLRRRSHNRALVEAAQEVAPATMRIQITRELAAIPLFNEDLEHEANGGPPSVRRLRGEIAAADGVLIATPEYNHSMPGVLKNALDWLSRAPDEVLAGKPVAVIGASSGPWGTRLAQTALRQVLFATEALVLPAPTLLIREAGLLFDSADRLMHAATRERLGMMLEALAQWIVASRHPALAKQ